MAFNWSSEIGVSSGRWTRFDVARETTFSNDGRAYGPGWVNSCRARPASTPDTHIHTDVAHIQCVSKNVPSLTGFSTWNQQRFKNRLQVQLSQLPRFYLLYFALKWNNRNDTFSKVTVIASRLRTCVKAKEHHFEHLL